MPPSIPFVPRCLECGELLSYEGAPHLQSPACSQQLGTVPQDPVEWTVYREYAAYPTLFGRSPWSRWYVFNHLFFSIGTGYAWVDGGLRYVLADAVPLGEAVPWRTWQEEEDEFLERPSSRRTRDTPWMREQLAQEREEECAWLRAEWAKLERKPTHWYPVNEEAPIFGLPENATEPWLLAACDALQMFWQGSAQGQYLRQVYHLAVLRVPLFARLGLVAPSLEETRRTIDLLREQQERDAASL